MIELATDGACSGNPGPGGWAYVIAFPDGTREEGSGGDPATTNNRMELRAVIEGLAVLPVGARVEVVTDSAYVEQAFTKGWVVDWERRGWARKGRNDRPAELKNAELWRDLVGKVRARDVSWRRVRGHSGHELNERCDELAVAATLAAGGDPARTIELAGRPAETWWWTTSKGGRCDDCREPVPAGVEIGYQAQERRKLCSLCVEERGLVPQVSKRLRAARAKTETRTALVRKENGGGRTAPG